jgi:hypothetical protein
VFVQRQRTRGLHTEHPAGEQKTNDERSLSCLETLHGGARTNRISGVVNGPILAGLRAPSPASQPTISTPIDRHYEQIRLDMEPLFQKLGIAA